MKILKESTPLLDVEVLEWLRDCETRRRKKRKRKRSKSDGGARSDDTVCEAEEALHKALRDYLELMPAGTQNSREHLSDLLSRLSDFELAPAEKLVIGNQRPDKLVHLVTVVPECETRLTEEQTTSLLNVVQEVLPEPPAFPEAPVELEDADEKPEMDEDEAMVD